MGCGLLAWLNADSLREHVEGDRFVSCPQFAIAAKAMHVLQGLSPGAEFGWQIMNIVFA
jgi:hypothetical protein